MAQQTSSQVASTFLGGQRAYDSWMESLSLPIHRGYYVEDLRTIDLGYWAERECKTAFLQLAGQEGVTESRVSEIPPGTTLPPVRFAMDEVVYVVEGRGLTSVWRGGAKDPQTFEWQKHSLFLLPRNTTFQLSNASGQERVLLLQYNYLPLAMALNPDPRFFFENPYESDATDEGDLYEPAKAIQTTGPRGTRNVWHGNFFPDMRAWDKLDPFKGRGAGGHVVWIQFPDSPVYSHMSVFPAQTYKKAHRHGPGVVIVIPSGEGFSVMWKEGEDKVFIPWHEASVFVPPDQWFHQHFNVGSAPGRYLALHAPRFLNRSEYVANMSRNQIEYPDEDPWIRETFASELAKRGLESIMPEQAYQDRDFEWTYEGDK